MTIEDIFRDGRAVYGWTFEQASNAWDIYTSDAEYYDREGMAALNRAVEARRKDAPIGRRI